MKNAVTLIKHFEGFSATPYLCPGGYWTIGYGHLLPTVDPGLRISEAQAETLLLQDMQSAEAAVARLLPVALTQPQRDALISFTFNLGSGALQRSTLRRKILRGEHHAAAREFHRWVYAGGRKLRGLMRRRQAEAELYTRDGLS